MTQPNKSKTRKNPSATPVKQPLKTAQTPVKPQTIYTLLVKAAIFLVVVVAVVKFTDFKGYFNPDYTNDHTRRKWNAFYQFTKDKMIHEYAHYALSNIGYDHEEEKVKNIMDEHL